MGLKKTFLKTVTISMAIAVMANCSDKTNISKKDMADISWKIPADIKKPKKTTTKTMQKAFDRFSWKSFIALNWPAASNGEADKSKTIGKDAPTVWEHWTHSSDIFLPDGSKPKPWGSDINTEQYCKKSLKNKGMKFLRKSKKISDFLILANEPMDSGPVIDQNGKYLQYEINLNENMFDYIVDNELYYTQGQDKFTQTHDFINFDSGVRDKKDRSKDKIGAIMVKAAWKILGKDDNASRFHTVEALIYNNPTEGGDSSCKVENVVLVGLHIATKTKSAPQWVWSTFEHIDNAPEEDNINCKDDKQYTLYNCKEKDKAVNTMAKKPWDANRAGQIPTQVTRIVPLTNATKDLNLEYQAKLKKIDPNTPWQYYMLISTQWPTKPGDPTSFQNPDPQGSPAPMVLANTTLETFTQGTIPQIGTSCTECHFKATNKNGKWTDFTYTLSMAHKQEKSKNKEMKNEK